MAVTRDAVVWGYRLILGREPESEQAIHSHLGARDDAHLAQILLSSDEFAARGHKPAALMPLGEAFIEVEVAATPGQLAHQSFGS